MSDAESRSAAPRSRTGIVFRVLAGVVFLLYPGLVFFGLTRWSPRVLALAMLAVIVPVVIVRLRRSKREAARRMVGVSIVTVVALLMTVILDASGFVLAMPVAINCVLLAGFGVTLRAGSMPMIERFARLQEDDLTAEQQAWCRLWTVIWCGFFLFNATTALVLTLAAPLSWWAAYNGLIAYVLIGILLGTEWFLRRRRFTERSS